MSVNKQHTDQRKRGPLRSTLRVFGVIGLTLLAIVLYFICDNMFSGYPQYHTELLSWIAMIIISLIGGIAWIVDERRHRDDD
jgi:formate hydrogenlyase subunit 3/multisubunit Na+/H+ antiporter MnhD subunit